MGRYLFLFVFLVSAAATRADVPIPGDPVASEKFIEVASDPNIDPGVSTAVTLDQLYPLASVPAQVVFHPKVLSRLSTLQQMGDKAVREAKTADPSLFYGGAVVTAQTWARKLGASEQKFWVFQVSFSQGPKGKPLVSTKVVGHFVAGAYTFHEGKQTFKVESKPLVQFPFLGTFEPKEGAFALPAPAP